MLFILKALLILAKAQASEANPLFQMVESTLLHCGKDGTATTERNM
jgi:hypothetical protein